MKIKLWAAFFAGLVAGVTATLFSGHVLLTATLSNIPGSTLGQPSTDAVATTVISDIQLFIDPGQALAWSAGATALAALGFALIQHKRKGGVSGR